MNDLSKIELNSNGNVIKKDILDKEFRIFGTVEDPLFLAVDIADRLGHTQAVRMVESADLDDDEKFLLEPYDLNSQGIKGLQNNTKYLFVNELGAYRILMRSRKPIAKPFQKELARFLKKQRLKQLPTDPITAVIQMPTTEKQIQRNKKLENIGWEKEVIDIRQLTAKANTRLNIILSKKGLGEYQIIELTKIVNRAVLGMDANELKKLVGVPKWFETRNILSNNIILLNFLFVESNISSKIEYKTNINYLQIKEIVSNICQAMKIIDDSSMVLQLNNQTQSSLDKFLKPATVTN